jgi:hypothetical protein
MAHRAKKLHTISPLLVGIAGWIIPGGGFFLLKDNIRATIIFTTIFLTFCLGIYIGSIAVIDPVGSKLWYAAQIMNSPIVVLLGHITTSKGYYVYGRPNEIGQIYTSIAGLLNLLCIINAVYQAHINNTQESRA